MTGSGAMIMGIFAAIWWVVGIRASGHGSALMYGVALFITGAIITAALRLGAGIASPEEHARRGRLVGIASGVEGVLILVAVNVLANIGKRDFSAPVVAIIVGLHFLPLARWLPARFYYVTSALLVGCGIAGFSVADADRRLLTVSIGAACALWLTCAVVLIYASSHSAAKVTAGGSVL